MDANVKALITQGTDDDKNRDTGYTPKYIMLTADKQISVDYGIGCLANAPHTTQTPLHSVYWSMWLAHCFLGRPIAKIDSVSHYSDGSYLTVSAKISGETNIHDVVVWATSQSDLDVSSWNGFSNYLMTLTGDVYTAEIPSNSTAYFIEVRDEANGVRGMISSPPVPVDKDYPTIPQAPAEISDFQAEANQSNVVLSWTNPLDADFAGLVIRYSATGYPTSPTDGNLLYDGTGSSATHNTTFENDIYYAVFCYDSFGNYSNGTTLSIEGSTDVENTTNTSSPNKFELSQNYPNPFNPSTTISYQLSRSGKVQIAIFSATGQLIRLLIDEQVSAGSHEAIWNGNDDSGKFVSSGVYFYQLKIDGSSEQTKKMLLLK
jgi:hypothetical protein